MYETNQYETNKWGLSNYSKELAERKEQQREVEKNKYKEATERNTASFKFGQSGLARPIKAFNPFKNNRMGTGIKPPMNMNTPQKPKKNPLGIGTTPNSNTQLARMKRTYP